MEKQTGLYIHIPFCDAKCHYCDFVTFIDQSHRVNSYLQAMDQEMAFYPQKPIHTLFIGGGTPSALTIPQFQSLMRSIKNRFDTASLIEATVEANPESATKEKLQLFFDSGINRMSFGLQSLKDSLLLRLGRLHNAQKFMEVYHSAHEVGFKNINVDLMFGLPGQTLGDWEETLGGILSLHPEHISTYALKIEAGTKFSKEGFQVDNDLEADMYLLASERLSQAGYHHYEISNFSKAGFESRHNLLYWEEQETIGIGISAASYKDGLRWKNTSVLGRYIEETSLGLIPSREESQLDEQERYKEELMLGLRLSRGVSQRKLDHFQIPMLKNFLNQGLAVLNQDMYCLTPRGWLVSNQLFQYFV